MESVTNWDKIGLIYGLLFGFGFIYNLVVAWLEQHGYDEGYTALLVVVGTAVTLGAMAVVAWPCALGMLGAFAASGFWMVLGSWWRHVQRRRRAQQLAREGR